MAKYIKDLPLGARVKFGNSHLTSNSKDKIKWLIVDKSSQYCTNGVTLFSEYGVDYRYLHYTTDSRFTAEYVAEKGLNLYDVSDINQWLNSTASHGHWWTLKGDNDNVLAEDAETAGFLYNFSHEDYSVILDSNIPWDNRGQIRHMTVKAYLPAIDVAGVSLSDRTGSSTYVTAPLGDRWQYDGRYIDWKVNFEPVVLNNRSIRNNPESLTPCRNILDYGRSYIDRDEYTIDWLRFSAFSLVRSDSYGRGSDLGASKIKYGIRPVLSINANTKVTNTTDNEGYYTVIFNTPPTKPSYIRSNTNTILGGNTATISWGTSSDPDGDPVKYVLQRRVNNGSWSTITSNLRTTSYTDSITFGWKTVQYRVAAYDNEIPNDNNSYTLSSVYNITNNTPPTISGADKDLGTFSNTGTAIVYAVKDAENNAVTVNISIDGKSLSNTSVTLGKEYKINLTGEAWITLNNGRHSVKIEATDSQGASATRTYTFIKSVTKMTFMNKVPYSSTNMPGRAKIYVNRQIPTNAIFKVYACNNAFDTKPTWEDVTSSVTNNLVFMFTNKTKTASDWGVKIKVVVDRNNTAGECYISEVGGNFA